MKPIPPKAAPQSRHKPFPELLRLALPIVVSLLSYSVMTMIDTLFVGRLGANSLAAVGLGGATVFLIGCFGYGILAGAKLLVSQALGQGHKAPLNLLRGLTLIALCLAPLTYLATLLAAAGLPGITAAPSTGTLAQGYASVRALCAFPYLLGGAIAQYQLALGDSKTPMKAALFAAVCNAPFNAFFLYTLDMGVVGVAWATVCARNLEAAALYASLNPSQRRAFYKPYAGGIARVRSLLSYGLPVGLERWLDTAAFTMLTLLLAQAGAVSVAAHQIVLQISHFCFLPLLALSEATSVLLAQSSTRSDQPQRQRQIVQQGLGYSFSFGTASAAFIAAFRKPLVSVFTTDADLAAAAQEATLAAAVLLLFFQLFVLLKGALRGVGRVRFVAIVSVSCAWVAAPPLTWLFGIHYGLGALGAWLSLIAEIALANVILVAFARRQTWFPRFSGRVSAIPQHRPPPRVL